MLTHIEAKGSLAQRAREAASRLARCGSLARPRGRWDLAFLVVERLEASIKRASKGEAWDPEHNLGAHPSFYIALIHVQLVMRGVIVKLARADVDADFTHQLERTSQLERAVKELKLLLPQLERAVT